MNNVNYKLDAALCVIMRAMWVYLLFSAFRLFGTVCAMYTSPSFAVGYYNMIPEMLEYLLAGCAVTVAFGTVFQYFSLCERDRS